MSFEFTHWEQASLIFLAYIFVCALLLPGLPGRARLKSVTGCAAALGVVLVSATTHPVPFLWRGLLFPTVVLFLSYWSSGLLFRGPMPPVECFLRRTDVRLRIRETAASAPRVTAEVLELAYAAIYVMIPMALAIFLLVTPWSLADVDRFWTVILITDFVCFGMLPWIQSRPPRSLEHADPWRASFRRFNLRLLGSTSIQVNTCPSGHAAEALAAALLVSAAPAPVFMTMLFAAAAVSAGAVYGRYHYAVDAMSGWLVAIVVWLVVSRLTLT